MRVYIGILKALRTLPQGSPSLSLCQGRHMSALSGGSAALKSPISSNSSSAPAVQGFGSGEEVSNRVSCDEVSQR